MARCSPTLLFMALLATSRTETSDGAKSSKLPDSMLQKPVQRSTLSTENVTKEVDKSPTSVLQELTQGSAVSNDSAAKQAEKPPESVQQESVQRSAVSSDNVAKESDKPPKSVQQESVQRPAVSSDNVAKESDKPPKSVLQESVQRPAVSSDNVAKESDKPTKSVLQDSVQRPAVSSDNVAKESDKPPKSVQQESVQRPAVSSDNVAKESDKPPKSVLQESVQRAAVTSDNVTQKSGQQPKLSPGNAADNIGENIVRKEAPLIRDIEEKMREGRETEQNLTDTRDVIRREMDGAGGAGEGEDRIRMEERLRKLDGPIGQLHSKNQLAEEKFRQFIGSIDSGKIHDEQQANSRLKGISHFVDRGVMGSVQGSKGALGAAVNVYRSIKGGIRHIFHSLLGLKPRQMAAGVNLLAGI